LMSGVTITKVPNVHLLIRVSEDLTAPTNPGKAGDKATGDKGQKKTANPGEIPTAVPSPGWQPQTYLPTPIPLPPAGGGIDASKIAGKDAIKPPLMKQPSPLPPPPPPLDNNWPTPPPVQVPPPATTTPGRTPIPSCALIGDKLENFALLDIGLTPWEYKTRKPKLMLLDFWSTTCVPCREAAYTLSALQNKYGPVGLEVIGIAYEEGTPADQAKRVTLAAQNLHTNYQLLLGGGKTCPVRRAFQVQRYPTLVLIDENGMKVWSCEGSLDRQHIEDLEFQIKRRLQK
jgi:thiol-disulfide isomerase/thioredoxin